MNYPVKKINFEQIENEDFCPSEPTVYSIDWDGARFDILVNRVPSSTQAVLLGTGSIIKKKAYPVFSRSMWLHAMPYNTLWYFDPTLYDKKLSLAWYYGNNARWYLKDIAIILQKILQKWSIKPNDTLCFGSSGGGFSSVLLGAMLQLKVFAMNPQLFILKFYRSFVSDFTKAVLKSGECLVEERIDTVEYIKKVQYLPHIFFCINQKSAHDINSHYKPFISKMKKINMYDFDKIATRYFTRVEKGDPHSLQLDKDATLFGIQLVLNTSCNNWKILETIDLDDIESQIKIVELERIKKIKQRLLK